MYRIFICNIKEFNNDQSVNGMPNRIDGLTLSYSFSG